MSGIKVRRTMEQIHISEEMQEQVIRNVQNKMENGKRRAERRKKLTAAAAILLAVGLVGIPAQALVRSFVMERMEAMPEREVTDMVRVVYERKAEADSFSREYTDSEKERFAKLWLSYEDGVFPKGTLSLVETEAEMQEGVFCYVIETGYFNLPEREMTDEELLQIIDFNKVRNYALSQTKAGQEARGEYLEKQELMERKVAAEGGIDRVKALEAATARMDSDTNICSSKTLYSYIYLKDISKEDYPHQSDVAYVIVLRRAEGGAPYVCEIDSADGSILRAGENLPYSRNILDE